MLTEESITLLYSGFDGRGTGVLKFLYRMISNQLSDEINDFIYIEHEYIFQRLNEPNTEIFCS